MSKINDFKIGDRVLYIDGLNEKKYEIKEAVIVGFNLKEDKENKNLSTMYKLRPDCGNDFSIVAEYVYSLDQEKCALDYIKNEYDDLRKYNKYKIKKLEELLKSLEKLKVPLIKSNENGNNIKIETKCSLSFERYNYDGFYFYYSMSEISYYVEKLCIDSLIGLCSLKSASYVSDDGVNVSVYYEGVLEDNIKLSDINSNSVGFSFSELGYEKERYISTTFYYQPHKKIFVELDSAVKSLISDIKEEIENRKKRVKNAKKYIG